MWLCSSLCVWVVFFLLCRFLSAEMIKDFSLSYFNKLFGVAFCSYVFIYWEIVKVPSIFTEFPRIGVQKNKAYV